MKNMHIEQRLKGIQGILNSVHVGSASLSNCTSGHERQAIIDSFLSEVFPGIFRFGTGDATDINGNKSGELDVVIENGAFPSLPLHMATNSRLYPAEAIAAVIEVKSDISKQWNQVLETANKLSILNRSFGTTITYGPRPSNNIPMYVIGYKGWKNIETLAKNMKDVPNIEGILVIDPGLFISSKKFNGFSAKEEWSLWGLIKCLYEELNTLKSTSIDIASYAK